ncbi:putative glycoside hydrolase family 15 protein [Actinosynnema sp. CS-041913]|uniref:putative glycoside hydrolase family 15 protein n=1 Tax=Actinosynnema sp. CS-041913 TaxID=3239917 RepID=UPI003D901B97
MPKESLIRDRPRRVFAGTCVLTLLLACSAALPSTAGEPGAPGPPAVLEELDRLGAHAGTEELDRRRNYTVPPGLDPFGPPPKPLAPCAWWYGIGEPPTYADLKFVAQHYDLVVLNAIETTAMRLLRKFNPKIKVLVYKDFASTRNYPGAVVGDGDAPLLPSGVGYIAAQSRHPEWFAVDQADQRIEWNGYPRHWQMAVWDEGYQRAWADAVTAEVVREGWDGVLADNDFNSLKHYSTAVVKGTPDAAATDRLIRDGMDRFLDLAGEALHKHGKMLIPNVSESQLTPGRWSAHSRYDGAMEENFGLRDSGGGELITFKGNEFKELRAQAALGESWLLLVTHAKSEREERVGYATAALLAGPYTCWNGSATKDYRNPDWSVYQDTDLGEAVETANRLPNGTWTRHFSNGWVAVNPTAKAAVVTPPPGLATLDGAAVTGPIDLAGADAVILVKPKSTATAPTPTPTPTATVSPPKPTPPTPPTKPTAPTPITTTAATPSPTTATAPTAPATTAAPTPTTTATTTPAAPAIPMTVRAGP